MEDDPGEAISRQLNACENDRFFRGTDKRERFIERGLERLLVGLFRKHRSYRVRGNFAIHHVVRHFDVNGSLVPQAGLDAADDFRRGALFIEQHRAGDGHFIVDPALRLERLHFVMKQRILFAVLSPRRAAHDDNWRFFRVRAGDCVEDVKPAHAISDTHQPDAVDARVGISGESRAGFVRHRDALDFRFFEPREGGESEIARNAEAVTDAAAVKVFEEELTQGHGVRKRLEGLQGDDPGSGALGLDVRVVLCLRARAGRVNRMRVHSAISH
jgi:hypothetical protein